MFNFNWESKLSQTGKSKQGGTVGSADTLDKIEKFFSVETSQI